MLLRKILVIFGILIILCAVIADIRAQNETVVDNIPDPNVEIPTGMIINNLSLDEKRSLRRQLMDEFIISYTENQTFNKIWRYMLDKYREKNKTKTPKSPDILLKEAFEKSNNLIIQTKKYFGNNFTRVYDPETVEKKVRRYLWLKGLYFWILGINDEHRLAVSYFYLSGDKAAKQDFFQKVVRFSYPEIPEVPENQCWREQMAAMMERLGYDIFSVKKFITPHDDLKPTPASDPNEL